MKTKLRCKFGPLDEITPFWHFADTLPFHYFFFEKHENPIICAEENFIKKLFFVNFCFLKIIKIEV